MQSRNVSLGEMFAWIPSTFRWFGRGTGTLLGASGIMLLAAIALFAPMYAVMFASMPMGGAGPAANPLAGQLTLFWVLYAGTVIASMLLFPPMMAGWFRLARDVDTGASVASTQILGPYRDPALWMRMVAYALLALLVYVIVGALFVAAFYRPVTAFMAQTQLQQAAIAAGQAPPAPDFPFVLVPAYFLFLGTMVVMQFAYMVGFAEASLRPTPAATALRAAFSGVLRNLHKLLMLMLVLAVAMVVVMMVVGLVLGLAMMVLSMISPVLGMIAMLALYVPVLLVMYPLMFGGHYFMWKDMLGGAAPDPGGVEA